MSVQSARLDGMLSGHARRKISRTFSTCTSCTQNTNHAATWADLCLTSLYNVVRAGLVGDGLGKL
jgi:hypothetical protein